MIMLGCGKMDGKFVVPWEETSGMHKQALRDVEEIDGRRSEQAIGRKTG
jgi:hypothetical protein